MNLAETEQALSLLNENIERFDRITNPTNYEVKMYQRLWAVYCYLNTQAVMLRAVEETENNIEKELDRVSQLSHSVGR